MLLYLIRGYFYVTFIKYKKYARYTDLLKINYKNETFDANNLKF